VSKPQTPSLVIHKHSTLCNEDFSLPPNILLLPSSLIVRKGKWILHAFISEVKIDKKILGYFRRQKSSLV
jgi:hypothetical protein